MTDQLPSHWLKARLRDVCTPVSQKGPDKNRATFKYIDLGAIDNKSKRIGEVTDVPTSSAPSRAKQIVRTGDVVFSTVRVYLENIAEIPEELDGEVASTAFCVLRPAEGISSRYLYHYVTSRRFVLDVNRLQRGNSPPSVQDGDIRCQELPLPPADEQRRIASRIDELFSRIDEGERALERVQKLVERYRQSVLKAAVTGELTRDWREKNKDKLESGEVLLARILKARREAWEKAELDKMKAKGITPANDKWKQKYEEPAAPAVDDLPELPDGWVWGSINQLCTLENGDRGPNYPSRAHYVNAGVPFITAGNIQDWNIDPEGLNFITEERFALLRAGLIEPGDLLFCLRGSLGKTALNILKRGAIASSLVIVRPVLPNLAKYLLLYFQSPLAWQEIKKYDNGTAQPNLAAADLGRFAVPIPPNAELLLSLDLAERAVEAVSRQVSVLRQIGDRAQALRQSTLKLAFSGALVSQNSSDEPAAGLLERIASEGSDTPAKPKRGRKPKTSEPA